MIIDITDDDVLDAECLGFYLGVPRDLALCTGDLSAKSFKVPNVPIYPKTGMEILATPDDILTYSRVTTAGTPPALDTNADTLVDIASLSEMTDYPGLYDGFELASIPTGADSIVASYAELLEPFVAQGVEPKVDQKADDINRINSNDTMYSYGPIKIEIKAEQIMSMQSIQYIRDLMFVPYGGSLTKRTGYSAYDMKPRPTNVYGYENIRWDDDIIGRIYFEQVTIAPDLPNVKAKGQVGFTLQMNVAKLPRLVLPDDV